MLRPAKVICKHQISTRLYILYNASFAKCMASFVINNKKINASMQYNLRVTCDKNGIVSQLRNMLF
jgi:hypothetical protein